MILVYGTIKVCVFDFQELRYTSQRLNLRHLRLPAPLQLFILPNRSCPIWIQTRLTDKMFTGDISSRVDRIYFTDDDTMWSVMSRLVKDT